MSLLTGLLIITFVHMLAVLFGVAILAWDEN